MSIVVGCSNSAVSDPLQQHAVCFSELSKAALGDWQVRLLTRILKNWENTSSCTEVLAVRRTQRVECQGDWPLMQKRGRWTCSQRKQSQREDGGTKASHACDETAPAPAFSGVEQVLVWCHTSSYTAACPAGRVCGCLLNIPGLWRDNFQSSSPAAAHKKLLFVHWTSKPPGWGPH